MKAVSGDAVIIFICYSTGPAKQRFAHEYKRTELWIYYTDLMASVLEGMDLFAKKNSVEGVFMSRIPGRED